MLWRLINHNCDQTFLFQPMIIEFWKATLHGSFKFYCAVCVFSQVNWISSYLTDRQQYVVHKNAKSDIEVITKGVSQGSVLGPTLFCLYFNTIVSSFENCDSILYADDTEIHYSDKDLSTAQTKVNPQDMTNIDHWLTQNRMIANVKKTKAMLIGSRQTIK